MRQLKAACGMVTERRFKQSVESGMGEMRCGTAVALKRLPIRGNAFALDRSPRKRIALSQDSGSTSRKCLQPNDVRASVWMWRICACSSGVDSSSCAKNHRQRGVHFGAPASPCRFGGRNTLWLRTHEDSHLPIHVEQHVLRLRVQSQCSVVRISRRRAP